MNFSIVLDVAIGLAFTYAVLAVIASALKEYIAGVFAWRGTYLSKGIDVLLDNREDVGFAWGGMFNFLRAHLTPAPADPPSVDAMMQLTPGQAQISPQVAAQRDALKQVLAMKTHPLLRGTPSTLPSYVSSRSFALAMLEALRDGSSGPLFPQLERTIGKLPDGDLKRTLTLFVQDAGGDLDAFRAGIEHWFDDAMDRLSGIYKRLSQYVLLLLGLVFAIALNVDSVHLAHALWFEKPMRDAVVASAGVFKPPPDTTPDTALKDMHSAMASLYAEHLPIGWSGACPAVAAATAAPAAANAGAPRAAQPGTGPAAKPCKAGWSIKRFEAWLTWRNVRDEAPGGALHLLGWLLSAFAISLGAPFWFDLVNKFTNLRASGPAPATADQRAAAARK